MKQRSARANSYQFRARRARPSGSLPRASSLLAEHGARGSLSSDQELAALQRFNQLDRLRALAAGGMSQAKAAKQCGLGRTSVWRWLKRYEHGGLAALAPQTDRCGRHSIADRSGLTPHLVKLLRAIIIGVGSPKRGFKLFAETSVCPPRLARFIRRSKTIPPSLRRLVAPAPVTFGGDKAGGQLVLIGLGGVK